MTSDFSDPAKLPEISTKTFSFLSSTLLSWFQANARDLPWRKNYTPYTVWIAEVMLQQTQMQRGVEYYLRWMERFPTVEAVATASEDEILRAWEGLGYYSRARNLHRAAKKIVYEYQGRFPRTRDTLAKLPGIGAYTSAAIAAIACLEHVACVDANVERIISRLFDIDLDVKSAEGKSLVYDRALSLIPNGRAREMNQAMMEFGALVCTKNPHCSACCVRSSCAAHENGTVDKRPVKKKLERSRTKDVCAALVIWENACLMQKRGKGSIWAGLTALPEFLLKETDPVCSLKKDLEKTFLTTFVHTTSSWYSRIQHSYTVWNVTLYACEFVPISPFVLKDSYVWIALADLDSVPVPSPHRKILDLYLQDRCTLAR